MADGWVLVAGWPGVQMVWGPKWFPDLYPDGKLERRKK